VSLLIGGVALVALGVTLYSVGFSTIVTQVRIIGWWFFPLIALELGSALCDAAVIHGFLGPGGRRPGFWGVLKAQVVGRSINLVTPMASIGEATKVTLLMRDTSSGRATAAVVRFNLSYIAVNLATVMIGAPICAWVLPLPRWMEHTLWFGSALALALTVAVALLLRAGLTSSMIQAVRAVRLLSAARARALRERLRGLDGSLRGEHGLSSWRPGLWALASKILGWVIIWVVMYANGQPPSVGVMATLASAGTAVTMAAGVVPMGLGLSEAGTAALMAALGEEASLGVTTVMARRAFQLVYAAVGLIWMATTETRRTKREM
jgi:uncharacterized membrane protein YbhN (UPF0104 family)